MGWGLRWIWAALAVLVLGTSAHAESVVKTDNVEASLIAELQAVRPGTTLTVALRLRIRDGWHTYWLNPGDSGEATAIDWTLPEGFKAGPIQWPYPKRLPVGPLLNFGYSGEVLHLVDIVVPSDLAPGGQVTLKADASWLVCEDICIPEEATLDLTLPVTDGPPLKNSRDAAAFAQTREALPKPVSWIANFQVVGRQFAMFLVAPELGRATLDDAAFFPTKGGMIRNAAPQTVIPRADGFFLAMEPGTLMANGGVDRLDGVLVLKPRGSDRAEAFQITLVDGPVPMRDLSADALGQSETPMSLTGAILFAFLGGLILNLMPCVLPVLSIKALSFLGKAGKERGAARMEALVYTLGVIGSFLFIGLSLISLREMGAEIGWGFQLQSPLIVTLLALLFMLVGFNFSGVFEVAGGFQNTGRELQTRSGLVGAFFTGVLAVVVAAPCTVPFMGAAIGYAVTQHPETALAVFGALGLGMAMPFLVLAIDPRLVSLLPRPGMWMVRLKEFLAFPMYATAAWLLWVLNQQLGSDGLFFALTAGVALSFSAWAFGVTQREGGTLVFVGSGLGLVLTIVFLTLVPTMPVPAAQGAMAAQSGSGPIAEPFTPARLAALRAENRPVFVNMTAAWCITCKVNELTALSSESMSEAFAQRGIAYLKGDWTNRDPAISRVLEVHGRSGVPLYLYYAPGAASAVILPEILTEGIVIDALDQAAAPPGP